VARKIVKVRYDTEGNHLVVIFDQRPGFTIDDGSTGRNRYNKQELAVVRETLMHEILTLKEIESRFESEWVLVQDPEFDEQLRVVRGKVIFHSKSRDELDEKDKEFQPKSAAYLYTGAMPENTAIVL